MNSNVSSTRAGWGLLSRAATVILLVAISSYCSPTEESQTASVLTDDEAYFVTSYARVAEARDLYGVNPLKSESLFAAVDSTIDTLRIANTIRSLNRNPDRWLLVFQGIERTMKTSSQGQD